mmetsp:Transcript_39218/g.64584  ORF Transcript_39218/g.64584 Transcript_39218/m.64584 type:complete len:93 (+) Transcript_39218:237-515(+)
MMLLNAANFFFLLGLITKKKKKKKKQQQPGESNQISLTSINTFVAWTNHTKKSISQSTEARNPCFDPIILVTEFHLGIGLRHQGGAPDGGLV